MLRLYSFQTTYEELKLLLLRSNPYNSVSLPDYLWGIETLYRSCWERWKFIGLPDYLWGIETRFKWRCCEDMGWLPDYLWGIETRKLVLKDQKRSASRLPMRNWNIINHRITLKDLQASRLPMRNWNHGYSRRRWRYCASRLPMRNWNYLLYCPCFDRLDCFQTTYEELKHARGQNICDMDLLPDYLWGIETGLWQVNR